MPGSDSPLGRGWVMDAACTSSDPDLFFTKGAEETEAKRVCNVLCTVREQCLEDILRYEDRVGDRWGVAGGLDRRERTALVHQRRLLVHQRRLEAATDKGAREVPE
jgi:WhiB family redox-sensing transcriptional regulator